jgi:HAE1 family hydrophobic/amphiphilic exporter-1
MIPQNERKVSDTDLARQMKLTLQKRIAGAKITTATSGLLGDVDEAPVQYFVSGNSMDSVLVAANRLLESMSSVKGVMDAKISVEAGNPEIGIIPDRDKMASLGITLGGLGLDLYDAFNGNTDAKFRDGNNEYDITVRLDGFDRKSSADVENFTVINASGNPVKLKQFAKVESTESPTQLERRNRAPSVTVSCQVAGRPSGDVGTDMKQVIADLNFPESISIDYSSDLENQDEGFGSLGTAILISLLLVYLIMVLLYNSYVYPFVVLFSVPLAIIGAFWAMALTLESLNVFSILGLLMLIGLVAKNAILVVDFTNQLKSAGMETKAALMEATRKRFRPIIMTTLSMVIGMLSVALAQGAGSAWKNGLAWVIIGGLLSSMFLTLVVVPLVYYLMDRVMMRFGWNKKKNIEIKENSEIL